MRNDYQAVSRLLDSRTLDLANLSTTIERRRGQAVYLQGLLGDYLRGYESRLHIAELQRYGPALAAARLAQQDTSLGELDLVRALQPVVTTSLDRLEDVLGGSRFDGKALDSSGLQKSGTFLLVGPMALFRSTDGQDVGTAETLLGSLEPNVVPFATSEDREAAAQLMLGTGGSLPLDPTLGGAQKVEAHRESWWQHVLKGGPVMVPIFALAGLALLVVLWKWLSMAFLRRIQAGQLAELLDYVQAGDLVAATAQAEIIGGPGGEMLRAGVEHLDAPPELVEEVMFERLLSTRLRLNGWLPFVAICATSAPLLGLLGTVTGIMHTFELMTVFGTGDPKTLSGGISEALITTEYGLLVAIPSLLLHALLSRRARAFTEGMEKAALALLNQLRKAQQPQGSLVEVG